MHNIRTMSEKFNPKLLDLFPLIPSTSQTQSKEVQQLITEANIEQNKWAVSNNGILQKVFSYLDKINGQYPIKTPLEAFRMGLQWIQSEIVSHDKHIAFGKKTGGGFNIDAFGISRFYFAVNDWFDNHTLWNYIPWDHMFKSMPGTTFLVWLSAPFFDFCNVLVRLFPLAIIGSVWLIGEIIHLTIETINNATKPDNGVEKKRRMKLLIATTLAAGTINQIKKEMYIKDIGDVFRKFPLCTPKQFNDVVKEAFTNIPEPIIDEQIIQFFKVYNLDQSIMDVIQNLIKTRAKYEDLNNILDACKIAIAEKKTKEEKNLFLNKALAFYVIEFLITGGDVFLMDVFLNANDMEHMKQFRIEHANKHSLTHAFIENIRDNFKYDDAFDLSPYWVLWESSYYFGEGKSPYNKCLDNISKLKDPSLAFTLYTNLSKIKPPTIPQCIQAPVYGGSAIWKRTNRNVKMRNNQYNTVYVNNIGETALLINNKYKRFFYKKYK